MLIDQKQKAINELRHLAELLEQSPNVEVTSYGYDVQTTVNAELQISDMSGDEPPVRQETGVVTFSVRLENMG